MARFEAHAGSTPVIGTLGFYGILGCMARYKYTKELLEEAVQASDSFMGVMKYLNIKLAGGSHSHIKNRIKKFEIDTSHFTGQAHMKNKTALNKKSFDQILIVLPEGSNRPKAVQLRRAMLECGMEMKCPCGISDEWNGKPITLEVDHIDGNWYDNRIENLRFLCPNCHSQETDTNRSWRNK